MGLFTNQVSISFLFKRNGRYLYIVCGGRKLLVVILLAVPFTPDCFPQVLTCLPSLRGFRYLQTSFLCLKFLIPFKMKC